MRIKNAISHNMKNENTVGIVGLISCIAIKRWKGRRNSHEKLRSLCSIAKVARRFPRRAANKKWNIWPDELNRYIIVKYCCNGVFGVVTGRTSKFLAILNGAITAQAPWKNRGIYVSFVSRSVSIAETSWKRARSQQDRKLIGDASNYKKQSSYIFLSLAHTVNIVNLSITAQFISTLSLSRIIR